MAAVTLPSVAPELYPRWRGWLHTGAFAAAVPGGLVLVLRASHASARVAAAVYAIGLLAGFGTSAAYHRLARTPRARRIMQRMDHSMIFVLIAGTYTPICLLALPRPWGIQLLCVVWTVAAIGILLKQFAFHRFKVLQHALYPGLGWAAVITAPALVRSLSGAELAFLAAGGLLYTIGIPVLALNRPNPWPRTFGYHEIWHLATVLAGGCHFAVVGLLVF
jgi:hemolysin III